MAQNDQNTNNNRHIHLEVRTFIRNDPNVRIISVPIAEIEEANNSNENSANAQERIVPRVDAQHNSMTFINDTIFAFLARKSKFNPGCVKFSQDETEFYDFLQSKFSEIFTQNEYTFKILPLAELHPTICSSVSNILAALAIMHRSNQFLEFQQNVIYELHFQPETTEMTDSMQILREYERKFSNAITILSNMQKELKFSPTVINSIAVQTSFSEPISYMRNVNFIALVPDMQQVLSNLKEIFHAMPCNFDSTLLDIFSQEEFMQFLYIMFLYSFYWHVLGHKKLLTFQQIANSCYLDTCMQEIAPKIKANVNQFLDIKPLVLHFYETILSTIQKKILTIYMRHHSIVVTAD